MTRPHGSALDRLAASRSSSRTMMMMGASLAAVVVLWVVWRGGSFYYYSNSGSSSSFGRSSSSSSPSSQPAFSLLVTLDFQDDAGKQEFLRAMMPPMATYVRRAEPQTLSYQTMQSDQTPLRLLILERYVDRQHAYLDVHKSSSAFVQDFRPQLQALIDGGQVKVSGQSYWDVPGVGFVNRGGNGN
eukprot:CAMPEP_0168720788 /NCGR_PEP_ID=MMETSP0724-20121128/1746_1 /TAXON_ID=265536 /ORGANISM="Amphiprora sp., Strain CCMP467" /LENGTH=185 /DNA_ID=CAMNT_0008767407 /DNA_START=37 /DNA_END=594 /DNA_ORIENTATION=-